MSLRHIPPEMSPGAAPLPRAVARFIDAEFLLAETAFPSSRAHPAAEIVEAAEHLYRSITERLDATPV